MAQIYYGLFRSFLEVKVVELALLCDLVAIQLLAWWQIGARLEFEIITSLIKYFQLFSR